MKELKDLSIEERTLITIRCEPFFLGFKKYKDMQKIFDHLMQYFPPNHSKDLWVFLTSTRNPYAYGSYGSLFSLRKGDYTKANKNKDGKSVGNISYVRCKRILETLHKEGYISVYKGYYEHSMSRKYKSCYIMEDKLIQLYDKYHVPKKPRAYPKETFVELKDGETGELITNLLRLKGIGEKREFVARYNKLLRTFDIRCKSVPVCAVFKQVYTDDLYSHGRWYSQSKLQTMRSNFRPYLSINGESCCEVDYAQMHPRILMTLEGVSESFSWEPYTDISGIIKGDSKELRTFSKFALLCLINAETEGKAKKALFKKYTDESWDFKLKEGDINKIFDSLKEKNHHIKHRFSDKDLWKKLQFIDSEIASYVIKSFTNLDKCILPWHDSFVVAQSDKELLIVKMKEAWEYVLGTKDNCFWTVEF